MFYNSPLSVQTKGGAQLQFCLVGIAHLIVSCYQDSGGVWHCYFGGQWNVCQPFAPIRGIPCPPNPTYAQTTLYTSYSYLGTISGFHVLLVSWTYCGHWDLPYGLMFMFLTAKNSLGQTIYLNNGADTQAFTTGTCNGNPCWQTIYLGNEVHTVWVIDNLCISGVHVSQVDHLSVFPTDAYTSPIGDTGTIPGSALPNIC
jgi:hypothetical protein